MYLMQGVLFSLSSKCLLLGGRTCTNTAVLCIHVQDRGLLGLSVVGEHKRDWLVVSSGLAASAPRFIPLAWCWQPHSIDLCSSLIWICMQDGFCCVQGNLLHMLSQKHLFDVRDKGCTGLGVCCWRVLHGGLPCKACAIACTPSNGQQLAKAFDSTCTWSCFSCAAVRSSPSITLVVLRHAIGCLSW